MTAPHATARPAAPNATTSDARREKADHDAAKRRLDVLATLSLLHLGHGQPQRGLTYAMLATTFSPTDRTARRVLAFGLYRNGAYSEALDAVDALIAELGSERDRVLELMRAECLKARGADGDDEAAQDAFWRVVALETAARADDDMRAAS